VGADLLVVGVGLVGCQNGTGKTTFIRMLAGLLKSDEQEDAERNEDYERAEACRYVWAVLRNVTYKGPTVLSLI
jgi:ABC-type multidrug transport system ATPase subunit